VDTGSILGVPALRPSFLVHVSAAESRETEAGRTDVMKRLDLSPVMNHFFLQDDDLDDDPDEDDDLDEDDDDDDDEDEDDEDVETWQVARSPDSR
jgi:hypothetical protein